MNLVFASGFFVPQRFLQQDYFRDLRTAFPGALFPIVPPDGTVQVRATALAHQINESFPNGPIHIVAHSMGGLDSRFVLSNNVLGLATEGRVVSLSTVSTPHRGSGVADLLVGPEPGVFDIRLAIYSTLKRIAEQLGFASGALGNLTTGFAAKFGCPNVPHIRYFSYAASGSESLVLALSHQYLQHIGKTPDEQANDGIVTVESAALTPLAEPVLSTDHFGEVGYNFNLPPFHSSFDHIGLYRRIVARATASK